MVIRNLIADPFLDFCKVDCNHNGNHYHSSILLIPLRRQKIDNFLRFGFCNNLEKDQQLEAPNN